MNTQADIAIQAIVDGLGGTVLNRDVAVHNGAKGLTPRQVAWAKAHDWFLCEALDGLGIVCVDRWTKDGEYFEDACTFHNFAELRAWAGY